MRVCVGRKCRATLPSPHHEHDDSSSHSSRSSRRRRASSSPTVGTVVRCRACAKPRQCEQRFNRRPRRAPRCRSHCLWSPNGRRRMQVPLPVRCRRARGARATLVSRLEAVRSSARAFEDGAELHAARTSTPESRPPRGGGRGAILDGWRRPPGVSTAGPWRTDLVDQPAQSVNRADGERTPRRRRTFGNHPCPRASTAEQGRCNRAGASLSLNETTWCGEARRR